MNTNGKFAGMTVDDCIQLQILPYNIRRLFTGGRQGVAATELLAYNNSLSADGG